MILTITLNASCDIQYRLDKLKIDDVNRLDNPSKTAGGKGLNVSRVLKELNQDVIATGFLGGNLGQFIRDELIKDRIIDEFYPIEGQTRNCVAIIHEGKQTEILESGPNITKEEEEGFFEKLDSLLDKVDVVCMNGSLPKSLNKDFYSRIVKLAKEKAVKTIVDTSGETLKKTLEAEIKPDYIKPNLSEISDLLKKNIDKDYDQLKISLNEGLLKDIDNILVSLGGDGAFCKFNGKFYKANIPKIKVVNPVGSGDSSVAGLIYGIENSFSDKDKIRASMTCGILNTLEERTGHINRDNFDEIFDKVEVVEY